MFFGAGELAPGCFSCNHDGKDCSSIRELAAKPAGGKKSLSVLGAGIEDGRQAGIFAELPASDRSNFSDLIQLGSAPSSENSGDMYPACPSADAFDPEGRSLVRSDSSQAGSSYCSFDKGKPQTGQ